MSVRQSLTVCRFALRYGQSEWLHGVARIIRLVARGIETDAVGPPLLDDLRESTPRVWIDSNPSPPHVRGCLPLVVLFW